MNKVAKFLYALASKIQKQPNKTNLHIMNLIRAEHLPLVIKLVEGKREY